jgi:hypothetical protein
MKKALVVLLILAVAGGLFAQSAPSFTVQGRFDTWWIPFQYVDKDGDSMMGAGLGRDSGSGAGPRARIFGEGKTDTFGIKIQLQFLPVANNTTGAIGFDDNVEGWWKPVEFFQIDAGKFVADDFRGKIGDNWMKAFTVPMASITNNNGFNNDSIFTRFNSGGNRNGGSGNAGVLGRFYFGDFKAGILFPNLGQFGQTLNTYEVPNFANGANDLLRTYEKIQIALGYTIADIGFVRAQFVGANSGIAIGGPTVTPYSSANYNIVAPRFELAFQVLAVEGLTLDIGGKYILPLDETSVKTWNTTDLKWDDGQYTFNFGAGALPVQGSFNAPVEVSLGAGYKVNDMITITGRVDGKFLGKATFDKVEAVPGTWTDADTEISIGPEVNVHLWPTFDLGFAVLGVDVGFAWFGETKMDSAGTSTTMDEGGIRVGGGVWLQKAFASNFTLKGGLAYSAATEFMGLKASGGVASTRVKTDGVFTIPVVLEYTF